MEETAPESPPMPLKHRLGSRLVMVGIFLLGLALGHVATVFLSHRHFREHPAPDRIPDLIIRRLDEYLGLNPGQKEKIRTVIAERHTAIEALHQETFARMKSEIEVLKKAIAAELDPKQAEIFARDNEKILPGPPGNPGEAPPPPGSFGGRPGHGFDCPPPPGRR